MKLYYWATGYFSTSYWATGYWQYAEPMGGSRLILVKRTERKKPESGRRAVVRGGKRR